MTGFSRPLQLIHARAAGRFDAADWSDIPAPQQELRLAAVFDEETSKPFTLAEPGLVRMRVVRLGASDAAVFIAELLDWYLYRTARAGSRQPPRRRLASPTTLALSTARWPIRDSGDSGRAAPSTLRSRSCQPPRRPAAPPAGRPAGAGMRTREVVVPRAASRSVAKAARAMRVSPRIVLLAVHLRVMNIITGEDDLTTGVVYNGRPEVVGGDEVCGLFLNTVPFRVPVRRGFWRDFVAAVAAEDTAIQPHRRYPLGQMLADAGRARLFETFFNYSNFHAFAAARRIQQELDFEADRATALSEFPIGAEFSYEETTSAVELTLRYDAHRFDQDFLDRLGGYYTIAMVQACDLSATPFRARSLLSRPERERLAAQRGTERDWSGPRLLHELVDQQRARPGESSDADAFKTDMARTAWITGTSPDWELPSADLDRMLEVFAANRAAAAAYSPQPHRQPTLVLLAAQTASPGSADPDDVQHYEQPGRLVQPERQQAAVSELGFPEVGLAFAWLHQPRVPRRAGQPQQPVHERLVHVVAGHQIAE
ncbi:MAG TPA: condensation domain-containing protein, partial [Streptosporangiaceae bacterium]|nr:condensation domain-containing protein [Streptosporangiaceae bacterium]